MKKIHSKLKAQERSQHFSYYKSMGIFSDAHGQVTHKFIVEACPNSNPSDILCFMGVLVACKNEENPIKNEHTRVVTTLFIEFSHAQGQLTPKSVTESCRNSNLSKLL